MPPLSTEEARERAEGTGLFTFHSLARENGVTVVYTTCAHTSAHDAEPYRMTLYNLQKRVYCCDDGRLEARAAEVTEEIEALDIFKVGL